MKNSEINCWNEDIIITKKNKIHMFSVEVRWLMTCLFEYRNIQGDCQTI